MWIVNHSSVLIRSKFFLSLIPISLPCDINAYFDTSCHSCEAGIVPPVCLFLSAPCRAARRITFMTVRPWLEAGTIKGPALYTISGRCGGTR